MKLVFDNDLSLEDTVSYMQDKKDGGHCYCKDHQTDKEVRTAMMPRRAFRESPLNKMMVL